MENRENPEPAERPHPEEPVPPEPEDRTNGAKEHDVRYDLECGRFITEVLALLEEVKADHVGDEATIRKIDTFAACISNCYSLEEMESHMKAKCDVDAPEVKRFYVGFVERTGDLLGGEAYEKRSRVCADLRRAGRQIK